MPYFVQHFRRIWLSIASVGIVQIGTKFAKLLY